MRVLAKTKRRW